MTEDKTVAEQPILTLADVNRWRKKRHELRTQLMSLRNQLQKLDQMLEAAEVFLPKDALQTIHATGSLQAAEAIIASSGDVTGSDSLPNLILSILRLEDIPLNKKQIRKKVDQNPYWRARLKENTNYFYTVMMRLEQRKDIKVRGDMYTAAPKQQTPGEPT